MNCKAVLPCTDCRPTTQLAAKPTPGAGDFSAFAGKLAGLVSAATGWSPDQFWTATPTELAALFAALVAPDTGLRAALPLDAEQLQTLKETYPDG